MLDSKLRAVIFDLDGVLTDTARLHLLAWTSVFNEFLKRRDPSAPEFSSRDYQLYVDGRPRADGVRAFLQSRGFKESEELIQQIAARKDEEYLKALHTRGPGLFPSSFEFLKTVRKAGALTAVVTASRNAKEVLKTAGIEDFFDTRVDGIDIANQHLKGKPQPDTFLEAAHRLNVPAKQAAVLEDAQAGVEAGRKGDFGQVIGIDRVGQRQALFEHGADTVVEDLGQLKVEPVEPGWVRLSAQRAGLPARARPLEQ